VSHNFKDSHLLTHKIVPYKLADVVVSVSILNYTCSDAAVFCYCYYNTTECEM